MSLLLSRRELNRLPAGLGGWDCAGMELGFSGEMAVFYHRYRHGYPAAVLDALVGAFGLIGGHAGIVVYG